MSNENQPNESRPEASEHTTPEVPPREPISVTPDRMANEGGPIAQAGNDDKLPTPTTSPNEPAASMSPPDPMVTETGLDTSNGGSVAPVEPDAAPVPTPVPVPTGDNQPGTPAKVHEIAHSAKPETPAKLDDQTVAEIDAAMADMDQAMGVTKDQPTGATQPRKAAVRGPRKVEGGREHRTGTVVSVGATDIFVEFGPKELGVVAVSQYADSLPNVGDALEVVVQKYEASESIYVCVRPGTVQKADWEMLESGQTVEAKVTGVNKGGLECEVAGHSAFMPASQVDIDHVNDLSVFVGEKLPCVVQKVDRRGKGNIVLSRREVIARDRAKLAETLKDTLKEGDTIEGTVRKIMDFGAFVDLGGIDGLVHISDLSHDRVNHGAKHVARHVSEGQKVTVKILKLDWDAGRISLGLKQLQSDPLEAAASEIEEGAIVSGKVTKCLDFGAFIEVAPGVEGLCHISELEYRRVNAVTDVVQPGEVVQVKVLKVDPSDRKISLSIKQTKEAPQREGGGKGRGRGGRGGRDDRDPSEILKETPELRRLREKAKQKQAKGGGGLGDAGGMGMGLGDLKL